MKSRNTIKTAICIAVLLLFIAASNYLIRTQGWEPFLGLTPCSLGSTALIQLAAGLMLAVVVVVLI